MQAASQAAQTSGRETSITAAGNAAASVQGSIHLGMATALSVLTR
jgi:hypothetical protein